MLCSLPGEGEAMCLHDGLSHHTYDSIDNWRLPKV